LKGDFVMEKSQEKKIQKENLSRIDLLYLKKKGLSNIKISRMTGMPCSKISTIFKLQDMYKHCSGVF